MRLLLMITVLSLFSSASCWFKAPSIEHLKKNFNKLTNDAGELFDDVTDLSGTLLDDVTDLSGTLLNDVTEQAELIAQHGVKFVEHSVSYASDKADQLAQEGVKYANRGVKLAQNGANYASEKTEHIAKEGARYAEQSVKYATDAAEQARNEGARLATESVEYASQKVEHATNASKSLAREGAQFAHAQTAEVRNASMDLMEMGMKLADDVARGLGEVGKDAQEVAMLVNRNVQHFDMFEKVDVALQTALGSEVCYAPYGCYSNAPPFDRPMVLLPRDPADLGTKFLLHTRTSWNSLWRKAMELHPLDWKSVVKNEFDGNKSTVFFVHGYIENRNEYYVKSFFREMLKKADMNVIFVEWSKGASFPYLQAVGDSRIVGAQIGHMIELLHNITGLDVSKCHVIGFSLGAHVAGYAGRYLQMKGHNLGRITGLDPAAPYFEYAHSDVRLDPSDALYVDVIHSDTKTLLLKGLGAHQSMGHADFYPNGGFEQPGCRKITTNVKRLIGCGHYRAIDYFIESVNSQCSFSSKICRRYNEFVSGKCEPCSNNKCRRMGYNSNDSTRSRKIGNYYLATHSSAPFCIDEKDVPSTFVTSGDLVSH